MNHPSQAAKAKGPDIESYDHEIGRRRRAGLPADTLTRFGKGDIRLRRMQVAQRSATGKSLSVGRGSTRSLNAVKPSTAGGRAFPPTLARRRCGNRDVCRAAKPAGWGAPWREPEVWRGPEGLTRP